MGRLRRKLDRAAHRLQRYRKKGKNKLFNKNVKSIYFI